MQVGFSMLEVGFVQKSSTRNVLVGIEEKEKWCFPKIIIMSVVNTYTHALVPLHVFSCS